MEAIASNDGKHIKSHVKFEPDNPFSKPILENITIGAVHFYGLMNPNITSGIMYHNNVQVNNVFITTGEKSGHTIASFDDQVIMPGDEISLEF